MGTVNSVVDIINGITRIAMALVPLGIVLGVLFGANVDLFNNVIINLINIIKLFSKESLIGLIALGIVIWLFGISGSASKSGSA
ncbi:MAG: hypothetical protein CFH07_01508 [Alphaproteobacteria bacterium MarineAlpha3_Bin6]|nr:MAG: hypothetical protein CFH07_01508 [Alphaproteobacteria bacterium MarineAlpha3_Bin6]HIC60727.1 hypothetical protein [Rhodospirillales bacterium]